jgi:phage-related protein
MKKKSVAKEYIAYEGAELTIEWYFNSQGKSPALEYFNELTEDQQDKALDLMQILADTGKIINKEKFNFEGDKIFVIKPSPDRFFCFFFKGAKLIVTNAYKKQSQKMPPREKERALKLKEDYTKRCNEGNYYD